MSKYQLALSLAAIATLATPAAAGEITGNGKPIDIHARSECAYSGLNDLVDDPRDPGYHTQSYGTLVGQAGWLDPSTLDPTNEAGAVFVPIPGFACNPNRWTDLHAE